MPNRIIKDSIRTSKSVNALSDFQFRLWLYLITYVDDYGRGSADPEILKGFVFPRRKGITEQQIQKGLDDLANTGMITLYEVGGESFFCFPNWDKHQRIQTKRSKYPEPQEFTVIHRDSPLESNPNPNPNLNPNPKEKRAGARMTPPTLEEIEAYRREKNLSVDARKFFDYYDAGGWKDGKGQPVRNWKQKLLTWEKYDSGKPAQQGAGRAEDDPKLQEKIEHMRRMNEHLSQNDDMQDLLCLAEALGIKGAGE